MPDEAAVRSELQALLRYANKTAVAQQLGVSPQTVINWAAGRYPSEQRLAGVRKLFGIGGEADTKQEAAPPSWARRPLALVNLLAAREGITEEEIATEADRIAAAADATRPPLKLAAVARRRG